MFLDRDRLQLSLDVEKTAYLPGETVRGTFRVKVLREVSVTALRVCLYAKEKASVTSTGGGSGKKESAQDEVTHFEQLFTFFGYSKESGRKGGARLGPTADGEEGLVYPFEVIIPTTAVPSFAFSFEKGGEASLCYKLQGVAVIPNGFDGKVEKYLRVLSCTPRNQFMESRGRQRTVQPYTIGFPGESSCCFGSDADPSVAVEMSFPLMVVFDESEFISRGKCAIAGNMLANGLSNNTNYHMTSGGVAAITDPNAPVDDSPALPNGTTLAVPVSPLRTRATQYININLKVVNHSSKKAVQNIRVELRQLVQLSCKNVSKSEVVPVSVMNHVPPSGGVAPRETYSATLQVNLGAQLSMTGAKGDRPSPESGGIIMPTMATEFMQVSNILVVSFPSLKTEEVLTVPDACWLVSAVDPDNVTPPAPVHYNTHVVLPEVIAGGAMDV